ncbi:MULTISPECIES: transporter [Bacillaceae]|nr:MULTISPECIES: transporter [Bacillaceae]MEC1158916.1 transporter [Cytobacillus horneckiae]
MKEKMKGWGWGALAFLTCPCHLILIIPLLAGTALGAYLTTYKTAAFIILGALFALSLYRVLSKMWPEKTEDQTMDCCLPDKKEVKS